jgi:hypothetical protein
LPTVWPSLPATSMNVITIETGKLACALPTNSRNGRRAAARVDNADQSVSAIPTLD